MLAYSSFNRSSTPSDYVDGVPGLMPLYVILMHSFGVDLDANLAQAFNSHMHQGIQLSQDDVR